MKRFAAFLFAAAAAFSLLSCGMPPQPQTPALTPPPSGTAEADVPAEAAGDAATEEKIVLDVLLACRSGETEAWFSAPGTGFVDRFESENPGVRLALQLVPPEALKQITNDLLADNEAPDVVGVGDLSALVDAELLMSAEEYCPEELRRDLYPALLGEGDVRALPDLVSVRALQLNSALLERSGVSVPATLEELEQACRKIAAACGDEVYPLGLSMTGEDCAACFAFFAQSCGGGFVGADGSWAPGGEANAEALAFAVGLVNSGLTNPNPARESAEELRALFAEGRLAMLLSSWNADGGETLVPFPAADGGDGIVLGSAARIAVFRDESAPDQAARTEAIEKFLRFFYAPDNYAERARLEGLLPASRSAAERLAELEPACAARTALLEYCRLLPEDKPGWDEVCEGLYSVELLSLIGGDVRAALDDLQASLAARR